MTITDSQARKALLLTRIAFERAELRRELTELRDSVRVPNLLRSAFGDGFVRTLFAGPGGAAGTAGWVAMALSLWRRYRVAAALFGSFAPIWRGRRRTRRPRSWLRSIRWGLLGAGVWLGGRALARRLR